MPKLKIYRDSKFIIIICIFADYFLDLKNIKMKNIFMAMALCLVCAFNVFAQNYTTVPVALVDNHLSVNGIVQLSIPHYDPNEVQIEPLGGFVAVPSTDQEYTIAEYPTLDAVWHICNGNAVWTRNLVTLDTYSGQEMNIGYAALKFAGSPYKYGYAKFDKSVPGAWVEFGYFVEGVGVDEWTSTISVSPNPVADAIRLNNVEGARIAVYSATGQQVKSVDNAAANTEISVSDLSSGIYFVKITSGSKVNTVKFVKE